MTRRQIKEQAARYVKFVEWSDEDGCFIGRCPELFGGAVHGGDEAKVYKELCDTVEEWIELLHKDGTPLPEATADNLQFAPCRRLSVTKQALQPSFRLHTIKRLTRENLYL